MQTLPGGDVFVGWGSEPYFSEFNPTGQLLFDAHLHGSYQSYRTYRFPWTGTPAAPARDRGEHAQLERARHRVRELERRHRHRELARARGTLPPRSSRRSPRAAKRGFETTIATPGRRALRRRAGAQPCRDGVGNLIDNKELTRPRKV